MARRLIHMLEENKFVVRFAFGVIIALVIVCLVIAFLFAPVRSAVVCPPPTELTNTHGLARLYEKFLAQRAGKAFPSDSDIIGASYDVDSCVHP